MITSLPALAFSLLSACVCFAESPLRIAIGAPNRKEFAATKDTPVRVYIAVPIKTTNTSKEAITLTTLRSCPDFSQFVRLKKDSNLWTEFKDGGCGFEYSSKRVSPGKSIESTVLVNTEYSGREYRVRLHLNPFTANSIIIESPTITLPGSIAEQAVAPTRSLPPSQKSTSPVRGPED